MRFRTKTVIVEAEQFWPDKPLPFRDRAVVEYDGEFFVITVRGERANLAPGDWVILEMPGEDCATPCKPDIFEATYEALEARVFVADDIRPATAR